MSLSTIVNVSIERQTKGVSQAGFGTLMLLWGHRQFLNRIKFYESLDELAEDGFNDLDSYESASSSSAYKIYQAAQVFFAQNPHPQRLAVGRMKVADTTRITIDDVQNNAEYKVSIASTGDWSGTTNWTVFAYTSDSDATAQEIAEGLAAVINAGSEPVSATALDLGTGTWGIDVSSDPAGTDYMMYIGDASTSTKTTDSKMFMDIGNVVEDAATAITNIDAENSDWYAVAVMDEITDYAFATSVIQAIGGYERLLGLRTSEDAVINDSLSADTGSVAKAAYDANTDRTFVIYNSESQYAEVAWFASMLWRDPGSATWAFKSLTNITSDELSSTQESNVWNKHANTYETIAGVPITRWGTVGSGEYIDVIRGIDWLTARIRERVYSKLVNLPKIPYTDAGISVVESELRAVLQEGIDKGLLASIDKIEVPEASEVSSNDKAARLLPDVKFEATLAGAVHKVSIHGVVKL